MNDELDGLPEAARKRIQAQIDEAPESEVGMPRPKRYPERVWWIGLAGVGTWTIVPKDVEAARRAGWRVVEYIRSDLPHE